MAATPASHHRSLLGLQGSLLGLHWCPVVTLWQVQRQLQHPLPLVEGI
jgi:hypothetical protein